MNLGAASAPAATTTPLSALQALSGTSTDASAAMRAYLASVSGAVSLSGAYFLDSTIEVPAAITSLELKAGTKLKIRGDHVGVSRTGSVTYREVLPAAMAVNKSAITVAWPTKYSANEYLLLSGDDSVPNATDRFGYLRRVTSVSGTTVNIDKALPRGIKTKPRTSAVTMSPRLKLFGSGEIYNTAPSSSFSPLVSLMAVMNPEVSGIDIHDNGASGIVVAHCKGGLIDCTIHDLLDDGVNYFGYGVNVVGSTRGVVVNGTMTRVRHSVTTNSGPGIDNVGSAGEPEDCWFETIAVSCTDKSVDTHRLGWNTTIVPHVTGGHGGVQIRADNTHVIGGEITGCAGPGISVNPLVAIAPTVDSTVISYLTPSGNAILADSAIIASNLDIRDCYGTNIVLASNSSITNSSIDAGGATGVQFNGSNNTVTNIKLGPNITTPYVQASGATNNTFTVSKDAVTLMAAPVATVAPVLGGDFRVGEQVTIDDGTWNIGPLTYAFTWMRDGVAISNATNRTYRTYDVVSADLGKKLTVQVTVKRAGYKDGSATTAPSNPVGLGDALVPTVKPVLSGTPASGQTLTVTRGTWDAAAQATSCAWLKNGVLSGDTGTTYKIKASDAGKTLSVTVTATRTGFEPGTFTTPTMKVTS